MVGRPLRDAWEGIRSRPGRAGLAFLAIGLGVASLSALFAVLGGLQESSRQLTQELGADVVAVFQSGDARRAFAPALRQQHAALIQANLPGTVVSTSRLYSVPTVGRRETVSVVATDGDFLRVRQWQLEEGRFLDRRDLERRERHAVVSDSLRRQWGWKLGSIVMLRDVPFRVVGVVSVAGSGLDAEWNDARLVLGDHVVLVPRTVAPLWVTDFRDPGDEVDALFIRLPPASRGADVVAAAQRLLSQPDVRAASLSWLTPESLVQRIGRVRRAVRWVAGTVSLLCLLLGGTTLMSLMIGNVRERVPEIGLRRALGALPRDVAMLFVVEACLVTGAAGVAGGLAVHLVLALARHVLPLPLELGTASAGAPMAVALCLGLVFSYWPANLAARIAPAEALRNE